MSTNLSDQMLPLIPRHPASAPRTPAEPRASRPAELLRQNAISLAAFIAITAIVVYLVART